VIGASAPITPFVFAPGTLQKKRTVRGESNAKENDNRCRDRQLPSCSVANGMIADFYRGKTLRC
jgi:hypothetical protein